MSTARMRMLRVLILWHHRHTKNAEEHTQSTVGIHLQVHIVGTCRQGCESEVPKRKPLGLSWAKVDHFISVEKEQVGLSSALHIDYFSLNKHN